MSYTLRESVVPGSESHDKGSAKIKMRVNKSETGESMEVLRHEVPNSPIVSTSPPPNYLRIGNQALYDSNGSAGSSRLRSTLGKTKSAYAGTAPFPEENQKEAGQISSPSRLSHHSQDKDKETGATEKEAGLNSSPSSPSPRYPDKNTETVSQANVWPSTGAGKSLSEIQECQKFHSDKIPLHAQLSFTALRDVGIPSSLNSTRTPMVILDMDPCLSPRQSPPPNAPQSLRGFDSEDSNTDTNEVNSVLSGLPNNVLQKGHGVSKREKLATASIVALIIAAYYFYPSIALQTILIFMCYTVDTDEQASELAKAYGVHTGKRWFKSYDSECFQGGHLAVVLYLGVPGEFCTEQEIAKNSEFNFMVSSPGGGDGGGSGGGGGGRGGVVPQAFEDYKPMYYFWGALELLVILSLLVTFVWISMYSLCAPHKSRLAYHLEMWSQYTIFFTLLSL
eukprot:gene28187-31285_t